VTQPRFSDDPQRFDGILLAIRLTARYAHGPSVDDIEAAFQLALKSDEDETDWCMYLNDAAQHFILRRRFCPDPAVTVLRNRARELAEKAGVLAGNDFWELPIPTR
jgi:hypothetical protein